jgi:uncharacterized protein YndB with AHSA1/START domain
MDSSDSIQRELTIEADPATVFAFFTDPQAIGPLDRRIRHA